MKLVYWGVPKSAITTPKHGAKAFVDQIWLNLDGQLLFTMPSRQKGFVPINLGSMEAPLVDILAPKGVKPEKIDVAFLSQAIWDNGSTDYGSDLHEVAVDLGYLEEAS